MNDNNVQNLGGTPLRNSNLANKPFRSPFSNSSTPSRNKNLTSISCLKTVDLDVQLQEQKNVIKRRKLNIETCESAINFLPTRNDLCVLKQKIKNKELEIDSLKIKLAYRKKHNAEALRIEINKWKLALQKALIQYEKDCKKRFSQDNTLDMEKILLMLNIPKNIIELSDIEEMS